MWPPRWSRLAGGEGHHWLHGVATGWGTVSFALRWHGERLALLWEVEPVVGRTDGPSAPVVTAAGLDPQWSGAGVVGRGAVRPARRLGCEGAG